MNLSQLFRVTVTAVALFGSICARSQSSLTAEPGRAPLTLVRDVASSRGTDFEVDGKDLILSRYQPGTAQKEVAAVPLGGGPEQVIVPWHMEDSFVARSDRFVVHEFRDLHSALAHVEVIDRATGATVGRVKLNGSIEWGVIRGNLLTVKQREGSIIELPSLKFRRTVPLPNVYRAIRDGSRIITYSISSTDASLQSYDLDWNPTGGRLQLPRPPCGTGAVAVSGDTAAVARCDAVDVVDLATMKIVRTFPNRAAIQYLAIVDGLLVTTGPTGLAAESRVFDLASGEVLGVLPVNAFRVVASGNILAALDDVDLASTNGRARILSVNALAYLDHGRRAQQIEERCDRSKLSGAVPDIYAFLDDCDAAGVRSVARGSWTNESREDLKAYVLALARTFDLYDQAVPLLARLREGDTNPALISAADDANFKLRRFGRDEVGLSPPKEGGMSTVQGIGVPAPISEATPIYFGAFPDQIFVYRDRIYVGRWDCYDSDAGVSLTVLDRHTLRQLGDVALMACDNEYQDTVSSISAVGDHLDVSLQARYQDVKRINHYVIDVCSLGIESATHVDAQPEDSVGTTADTLHWHVTRHFGTSVDSFSLDVAPLGVGSPVGHLKTEHAIGWSSIEGRDNLLLEQLTQDGFLRLTNVDLPSGERHTLIGLRASDPRYAVDTQNLYLGFGRSLVVVGLDDARLKAWISDFIPGGIKDNHHSVDNARIDRLLLDQGRLIALTADGVNSRTIAVTRFGP
jgi:hypothetical protein